MMRIPILIPIHNRLTITQQGIAYLKEALENYSEHSNAMCDFQIVVIDDGSTDGSAQWIQKNHPDIHLLSGDGNLWWSGAINLGAAYSIEQLQADFLLLWNDDVIPEKDYFIKIEQWVQDEKAGNTIVGSKIMVHQKIDTVWSMGGFFNRFSGQAGIYDKYAGLSENYLECDWQPGMGTLVPTSIIKNHKLWWDEKKFPQYHGDSDFVLRCKRKGVRVITNLEMILYNRTELTGVVQKESLRDLYMGLTSIRSNYNLYRYLLFYTLHGALPFAYVGLFKKYFFYVGGYVKHTIFKSLNP